MTWSPELVQVSSEMSVKQQSSEILAGVDGSVPKVLSSQTWQGKEDGWQEPSNHLAACQSWRDLRGYNIYTVFGTG